MYDEPLTMEQIAYVCNFFKERMHISKAAKIHVRFTELDDCWGKCSLTPWDTCLYGSAWPNEMQPYYIIEISTKLRESPLLTITTLAHEFVHIQQIDSGFMVADTIDSIRGRWWGDKFYPEDTPYREAPWEVHAFALESVYAKHLYVYLGHREFAEKFESHVVLETHVLKSVA